VAEALSFHHGIGAKNKEERLRYLKNYWANAIKDLPGVRILTSFDPQQSCGIGTFTVENMDLAKLSTILSEKHKILVAMFKLPDGISAIRVTPSIYTTLRELDLFIEAVTSYVKNGLPQ
jgi:selenocysteine lyase/cysteine desulfurase